MAEKSVKQRIELTGEKEYNAAIKEAQRNLRVLRSELLAESAELGKNATEQDKNAAKAKSLKQQIQEQEKIVETMRAALEEARQAYGDNSDVVSAWEIKLNNARATLGNMRSDLESASGGIADAGASFVEAADGAEEGVTATKAFADALTDVGNVFGSVSDGIEKGFTDIVGHVKEAVAAIWGQLMEVSARANEWTDLGAMFGTSAGNIQKWYHSVNAEAKDFTQLVNFANKILTGDQTKIAEATQVDLSGYTDQWEGFVAVMNSLSKMDKQGQMDALAHMGITGPKEAGWLDMLGAWQDVVGNLPKFDAENGGIGVSEEGLAQMNELSLKVANISTTWQAFKDSWLEGLTPLALDLTSNVQGALDALIAFMNADPTDTEARERALEDLKTNLTEFFTRLGQALSEAAGALDEVGGELQKSDNSMVRTIGNVLQSLSSLLEWFSNPENIGTVIQGFEALATFWLVGKGAQLVSTISGLAANFTVIKGFGAAGAGTTAAGTAAAGGLFSRLLTSPVLKAAGGVTAFVGTLLKNALTEQGNDDILDANGNVRDEAAGMGWRKDANGRVFNENYEEEGVVLMQLPPEAVKTPEEVEEWEDLTEGPYTREQAEEAIQDWWDAWRNADKDPTAENQAEEESAFQWMQEVLGEGWGDVYDMLIKKLDEERNPGKLEDIPQGWYSTMLDTMGLEQQTSGELKKSIDNLAKTDVEGAAARGIANGMRGVRVIMDAESVGRLVTPWVSQYMARDLIV